MEGLTQVPIKETEKKEIEILEIIFSIPRSQWSYSRLYSKDVYRTYHNGIYIRLHIGELNDYCFVVDEPIGYYIYPNGHEKAISFIEQFKEKIMTAEEKLNKIHKALIK